MLLDILRSRYACGPHYWDVFCRSIRCRGIQKGFKREITIPRELWVGYIKDYEGGTLMQVRIMPKLLFATRAADNLISIELVHNASKS